MKAHYQSAVLRVGLRPWALFLTGIVSMILMSVISRNFDMGFVGMLGAVALLFWFLFWVDAIISKIRDVIRKRKLK